MIINVESKARSVYLISGNKPKIDIFDAVYIFQQFPRLPRCGLKTLGPSGF
jgi:hypothetical protein